MIRLFVLAMSMMVCSASFVAPVEAKSLPKQIGKVFKKLKPIAKLVGPAQAFLELTGIIESLDDKVDRLVNSDLDTARDTLKLARTIKDQERRMSHIEEANNLLRLAINKESDETRLLLAMYLSGTVYLAQGEVDAAVVQFKRVLEHLTGQEEVMFDYIKRTKGYDFKKKDGSIFRASCIKESIFVKAANFAYRVSPLVSPTATSIIEYGVEKYKNSKKSEQASILIKRTVLDFFKLTNEYQTEMKHFSNRCSECKNSCCYDVCYNYSRMFDSFFNPKLNGLPQP